MWLQELSKRTGNGVTSDSTALLRKWIHDREQTTHAEAGWYENLFNWSPRLTTLLSALTDPLTILLPATYSWSLSHQYIDGFCLRRGQYYQLMVIEVPVSPLELLNRQDPWLSPWSL